MRIPRIYQSQALAVDSEVELSPEASHHLANVLRIKAGQNIVLFNGDGNEYTGVISSLSKRHVNVYIDAQLSISVESTLPLHLGQGVSKGDRMEMVIQKAVELGVHEITPIVTERCNVKLNAERWHKKQQQWQKIIIAACEQSGRNKVPQLHPPLDLSAWLQQSTECLRLMLDPHAEQRMQQVAVPPRGVRLLIGPEGGFSTNECYTAEQAGYQTVRFGPRVLRTETAALASIAVLQALYGDL